MLIIESMRLAFAGGSVLNQWKVNHSREPKKRKIKAKPADEISRAAENDVMNRLRSPSVGGAGLAVSSWVISN